MIEALNRVWQQSLDPADRRAAPLRSYLSRRGLSGARLDGGVVRFHPALGYWKRNDGNEAELVGRYPALVALVTGADGAPVTVHRTYLTPDGRKAPVPDPKKLMGYPGGRLVGGAIRLFGPGPTLGVAEGIETALAVHLRTGMPVWSAVSAGLLARLEPPAETALVVVWADRDRSGVEEAAALTLRERLLGRGIPVAVHLPPGRSRRVRRESTGPMSGAISPRRRLLERGEETLLAQRPRGLIRRGLFLWDACEQPAQLRPLDQSLTHRSSSLSPRQASPANRSRNGPR